MSSENEIVVERIREFWEFETLSSINVESEITFLNNTKENQTKIIFDLGQYKLFLKLFDTDGNLLEFSKNVTDIEGASPYCIEIKLPRDRLLYPGEYRTITIKYVISVRDDDHVEQYENSTYSELCFPLKRGTDLYIVIKSLENFEADDYIDILDEKNDQIDLSVIDQLIQEGKLKFNRTEHIVSLMIKGQDNQTLRITHHHKVHHSLISWVHIGAWFGAVSAIVIPVSFSFLILNHCLNSLFISFPIFVITVLIVIKGWLFSKDLDSSLENMNRLYIIIVTVLIVELFVIVLLGSMFMSGSEVSSLKNCTSTLDLPKNSTSLESLASSTIGSYNQNSTITINMK